RLETNSGRRYTSTTQLRGAKGVGSNFCPVEPRGVSQPYFSVNKSGSLRVAQQCGHLVAQQLDFLVGLAELRQQPQIVARDRAAGKEPRPDAEELVELHQLPVAHKDAVFAHQSLDQPLKLPEDLRREEELAIGLLLVVLVALFAGEQQR